MKINTKELIIFLGCVAAVITTHADLMSQFSEGTKDIVMLLALSIIGFNHKVIESKAEGTNE